MPISLELQSEADTAPYVGRHVAARWRIATVPCRRSRRRGGRFRRRRLLRRRRTRGSRYRRRNEIEALVERRFLPWHLLVGGLFHHGLANPDHQFLDRDALCPYMLE